MLTKEGRDDSIIPTLAQNLAHIFFNLYII
jgi:hypothetical protein